MTLRLWIVAALLAPNMAFGQPSRMASDFEIAQMERQIAQSRDVLAQLSARLNLGDLRASRNERAQARTEFTKAADIAVRERRVAREASEIVRYATATAYEALARARLGQTSSAYRLLEESIRYTSDSAKTWNLYSSAMSVLQLPVKAVSAARNAVSIAAKDAASEPSVRNRLDLAIYRYALASGLIETGQNAEAERLLRASIEALDSRTFDALRRDIERREQFEVYSSAMGAAAAWLSISNRARLRLAALLEDRGDVRGARESYERVLSTRTDDPTALAALARLAASPEERDRYFAEAFDANPFSLPLIRQYERHLQSTGPRAIDDGNTTGAKMRNILALISRREYRTARSAIEKLMRDFPDNEALRQLMKQTEETLAGVRPPGFLDRDGSMLTNPTPIELRRLLDYLDADRLSPEQRAVLDRQTFASVVHFEAWDDGAGEEQSTFAAGMIEDVPFRFAEPTAFRGSFAAAVPLRLTYRILGLTEHGGLRALLVEPVQLEAVP